MEPYHERVSEVIKEEFAQQGLSVIDLPERVQEALKNIRRRIANDLEYTSRFNLPVIEIGQFGHHMD